MITQDELREVSDSFLRNKIKSLAEEIGRLYVHAETAESVRKIRDLESQIKILSDEREQRYLKKERG